MCCNVFVVVCFPLLKITFFKNCARSARSKGSRMWEVWKRDRIFNRPSPTLLSSDLISEANTFAVNEKVYGGLIELRNELKFTVRTFTSLVTNGNLEQNETMKFIS